MINLNNRSSLALSVLRVSTGAVFIAHGAQKVFGLFGGSGLEGFAQWSATLGISSWLAYAAAFFELIGGVLLVLGVATSLAALMTAAVMVGAIWYVHLDKGFFSQNGGYEYALVLLINSLVIFLAYGSSWPMQSCSTKGKKDSCC